MSVQVRSKQQLVELLLRRSATEGLVLPEPVLVPKNLLLLGTLEVHRGSPFSADGLETSLRYLWLWAFMTSCGFP